MIIVTGHLLVDPSRRAAYLESCRAVVEQAREAEGCLDFALSADLVDPARIDVQERWVDLQACEAFRGAGVPDELGDLIIGADVTEHEVTSSRRLA